MDFSKAFDGYVLIALVLSCLFECVVADTDPVGEILDVTAPGIRVTEADQFRCMAFALEETYYVTALEPIWTTDTIHHMALVACERPDYPAINEVWDCQRDFEPNDYYNLCDKSGHYTQLAHTSVGNGPFALPNDIGIKIGKGTVYNVLVLQIHYGEEEEEFIEDPNLKDYSGYNLRYQTVPTLYLAGVFNIIKSVEIDFPPDSEQPLGRTRLDDVCTPTDFTTLLTKPVTFFAYQLHTHSHGIFQSAWMVRNKTENNEMIKRISREHPNALKREVNQSSEKHESGEFEYKEWELIVGGDSQDQTFYHMAEWITIYPGDLSALRCVYSNPTDEPIPMGYETADEMCAIYVMYYETPDETGNILPAPVCTAHDEKTTWEKYYDLIGKVPDWVQAYSMGFLGEIENNVQIP